MQKHEYEQSIQEWIYFERVAEVRIPRRPQKLSVFIKKPAAEIQPWPADAPCRREDYVLKRSEPINQLITPAITQALIRAGHYYGGGYYC